MEIPRELRENLGLSLDSVHEHQEENPSRFTKERTRSILKKNSILCTGKKPAKKKVSMFFNANQADSEEAIVV